MSRPLKTGLDYYPMDASIDEDDKFFDLFDSLGSAQGLGIVIMILGAIYKGDGYFLKWNDSTCKKFSRKKQVEKNDIETAIEILTGTSKDHVIDSEEQPFFDTNLFRKEKILTSSGIQKRFFLAADRRKERKVYKQYMLLPIMEGEIQVSHRTEDGKRVPIMGKSFYVTLDKKDISIDFIIAALIGDNDGLNNINVNNNSINDNINNFENPEIVNVNINSVNVSKSTQTKGEETKRKENKLNREESINTKTPPPEKKVYGKFPGEKKNPKPQFVPGGKKPDSKPEESIGLGSHIDATIDHWNTFDKLPRCRFNSLTLPEVGAISNIFAVYGKEDIDKAVNNLARFIDKENFKPASFTRFVLSSLDRWVDDCKPWDRYQEYEAGISQVEKDLIKYTKIRDDFRDTFEPGEQAMIDAEAMVNKLAKQLKEEKVK